MNRQTLSSILKLFAISANKQNFFDIASISSEETHSQLPSRASILLFCSSENKLSGSLPDFMHSSVASKVSLIIVSHVAKTASLLPSLQYFSIASTASSKVLISLVHSAFASPSLVSVFDLHEPRTNTSDKAHDKITKILFFIFKYIL